MGSIRDQFTSNLDRLDTCPTTANNVTDLVACMSEEQTDQIMTPMANAWHKVTQQMWSPCTCLLVVIPIHLAILMYRDKKKWTEGLGAMTTLKASVPVGLALTSLIQMASDYETTTTLLITGNRCDGWIKTTEAGVFGMIAAFTILDRKRRSPGRSLPLLAFWGAMVLTTAGALFFPPFTSSLYPTFHAGRIIDAIRFLAVLLAFALSWFPGESPNQTPGGGSPQESDSIHPEDKASWWGRLTLSWSTCMVWAGFSKGLEETDVPDLHPSDRCSNVSPAFERGWKQEEFRCKLINDSLASRDQTDYQVTAEDNKKDTLLENSNEIDVGPKRETVLETSSLFKVLLKTWGLKFFFLQTLKGVMEMTDFIHPLLTAALMTHIQNRESGSAWYGIGIVVGMFLIKCAAELAHHRVWFTINRLSRRMKSSVMMLIFKKSITLQNESKKGMTNGEIVNLISDDCDRVFNLGQHIFLIIMTPLNVCTALYLLYIYLGGCMLVGLAIMLVLIPINSYIGRRMNSINEHQNEVKDKRVKLMNEIINGIKVLKLYAWEKSFIEKVGNIRGEEIQSCQKKAVYSACIDSIFRAIPFLVKVGAFGTYLILGGHLDPVKGFVVISLFHNLNHPLSLMALLMPVYMEALVSLKRITKFLNGEDISSDVITKTADGQCAVQMKDGVFTWEKSNSDPTLTDINVEIPKGKLVAVVGTVGSGKSSLLSAILGEMEKLDGKVNVQGRLAYVPQEAWILNASLQENVLFGSKMDKKWYRQVVHGCNLKSDINIMEAGDKIEIGEKGINLSGGQKQRVSLARAVYNDADVYLLDDPLSAVDAHVGKNIFNEVISHRGLLKEKTRVLVTHGVHWLPFVDSIIVMRDGQISEAGTYEQLLSRNGAFAQFLSNLSAHSSEDEDEEVKRMKQNMYKRINSVEIQNQQMEISGKEMDEFKTSPNECKDEIDDDVDESDENESGTSSGKLIDDEELEHGAVKKGIYLDYLKAIGLKSVSLFSCLYFVTIVASNYNMYTIKLWTDDPLLANTSLSQTEEYSDRSWHHFLCFFITGLIEVVSAFLFIMLTMQGGFNAANRIHKKLLNNIMRCPMSFFDTTPSCRVINRFSTDIARVDGLTGCLRGAIERFFIISVSLSLMIMSAPITLVCVVPASVLYYFLHRIHVSTIRQLRRYRSKYRSPIFVHFSETLNGVSSIRAYTCQSRFITTMEKKIEEWMKFDNMELAVALWFGMRLCCLHLIIQMVSGLVVVLDTSMTAGMAGLVLMYAGEFSGNMGALVHMMTHVETEIVSLERVLEYAKKPIEAPWDIAETKPSADWPQDGHVVLHEYKARYREGLDLVLKGVNCDIKNGEKIGIIGRTGAGKSSLTMALFRLVEAASGHIELDNEKIADLGLHDLRSKITILPQDPVIFAGSLRMNLDPFQKCTTEELWEALQHSHLKSYVEGLPNQLDFECGEGGKNLSVGQRQLLCLARTLLRQTRILVLDEATAAVDMETDELIQKTIRKEFSSCTVLTIAHRLNTIMDYDRILVLDQGVVKEFDSPNNLLADKNSTFYSLAKDAKLVQ